MAIKSNLEEQEDAIVAEINMTPLIDIMLVLLIIFMVSSSVSLDSGLDIELPGTSSKVAKKEQDEAIIISLDGQGEFYIQGKRINFDSLEESLKREIESSGGQLVIFEGDKGSRLGKAIEVMDLAKKAGAKGFAIATQENPL